MNDSDKDKATTRLGVEYIHGNEYGPKADSDKDKCPYCGDPMRDGIFHSEIACIDSLRRHLSLANAENKRLQQSQGVWKQCAEQSCADVGQLHKENDLLRAVVDKLLEYEEAQDGDEGGDAEIMYWEAVKIAREAAQAAKEKP